MNELFYQDAYRTVFDSEVISCTKGKHGYEIVLKETAFYPEGGGQPGDQGTLNEVPVKDTRRKNGTIVHITDLPLEAGTAVHGTIDWNRRFDLMQQHSGEHIFSGIVHQLFGYENIGFHLGEETITLDFSGPLTWEDLRTVETKANEILYRNEPIEISYPSPEELAQLEYRSKKELEGLVRIVTVPGADVCACCGTHVHRTGEIGLIKVLSTASRKNGTRTEIVCGRRALRYVQTVTDQNLAISHLLSAPVSETSVAVERLRAEMLDSTYRLRGIILHQLEENLKDIEDHTPVYVLFTEGIDTQELRKYANQVIEEKHAGIAAMFTAGKEGMQYVILSSETDLKPLSRLLNERFSGRGGGSSQMIQGSLHGEPEEIRTVLQAYAEEKADH